MVRSHYLPPNGRGTARGAGRFAKPHGGVSRSGSGPVSSSENASCLWRDSNSHAPHRARSILSRPGLPDFTTEASYSGRESNAHALRHPILNRAWIPFHHRSNSLRYAERESNPHALAGTSTSSSRDCHSTIRVSGPRESNPTSPDSKSGSPPWVARVRWEGVEPSRPCGHCGLNAARIPFRHQRA
jgi:hypothetical protein